MYRAFEDVDELQRESGVGEKEENPFSPYPVENGSDHEEGNGTNGIGDVTPYQIVLWSIWTYILP